MGERSYVWDNVLVGDATTAPYSSSEWAEQQGFLAGASKANYGVIDGTGDGTNNPLVVLASSPASKIIHLKAGAALCNGRLYINDADLPFTVQDNASGNARVDMLVIRRDTVAQTARAVLKQGTPAATPVPPTLTQNSTTWEIPLAVIDVANGFSTISQNNIRNIENMIGGEANDYYDDVLNNSGVRLETGDVVVWDFSAVNAVKRTTTPNDSNIAGIWKGSTAAAGRGRVQRRGWGWIKIKGLLGGAIGDGLQSDSTATQATYARLTFDDVKYGLGRLMETVGGSDPTALKFCYIDVAEHPANAQYYQCTIRALTSGAWRDCDYTRHGLSPAASIVTEIPGISVNLGTGVITITGVTPFRAHLRWGQYRSGVFMLRVIDGTSNVTDGEFGESLVAANAPTFAEMDFMHSAANTYKFQCRVTTTSSAPTPPFSETDLTGGKLSIWGSWH